MSKIQTEHYPWATKFKLNIILNRIKQLGGAGRINKKNIAYTSQMRLKIAATIDMMLLLPVNSSITSVQIWDT